MHIVGSFSIFVRNNYWPPLELENIQAQNTKSSALDLTFVHLLEACSIWR